MLFKLLKRNNYILAIATTTTIKQLNIYRYLNEHMIKEAPIDKTFDLVLAQDDVTNMKPNPEVHFKIMDYFNCDREECLIFEDSLSGIQAGNNAGIDVVAMYDKFSDNDREAINNKSRYQFNDFTQVIKELKKVKR